MSPWRAAPASAVRRVLLALVALASAACAGAGPRAVVVGDDACDYCRMEVGDARFAAEVVTGAGRVHIFDSIDCMVDYVRGATDSGARALWVTDAEHPGGFVQAERAGYLVGASLRGPMGGTVAFADAAAAREAQATYGGTVADWAAVLADTVALVSPAGRTIDVQADPAVGALAAAVAAATPGTVIRLAPGTYREPTVVVRVPRITITGDGAILDGEGKHEILVVHADSVTIRGLTFMNTGVSQMQDRAALRVMESRDCLIEGNRFRDALFAIYLQRTTGCEVRGNDIVGAGLEETRNGNGIHLWYSPGTRVVDNTVSAQRDGIYFEFSRGSVAAGNVSEGNRRYGLHFMFSDSCRYVRNTFRANGAGVAVMYSHQVVMDGNGFLDATGSGAFGLLLKEIADGALLRNRFIGNSTGLFLEGASRLDVRDNDFRRNGWAIRLMADAEANHFRGNVFAGNAFDVSTNSRTLQSDFDGNWWDAYTGYDIDRDGTGDVPFRPVRLFALVVEKHPESLLLLRAPVTAVLDAAERVFPVLTPALADAHPLMRAPR